MKSFQEMQSPAIPLTSFHDLPVFLISSSIVFRHVLFGLPLLLYPWGFQSNAVFSIALASLRNVCPIQFPFFFFLSEFLLVILHSSSFVILSVHFIFIIRLKRLFINVCKLLVIWLVVFQVSQAYNNTDFTFVLNIRILTLFMYCNFSIQDAVEQIHHLLSWFYLLPLPLFLPSLTPHFLRIQRIPLLQFLFHPL